MFKLVMSGNRRDCTNDLGFEKVQGHDKKQKQGEGPFQKVEHEQNHRHGKAKCVWAMIFSRSAGMEVTHKKTVGYNTRIG